MTALTLAQRSGVVRSVPGLLPRARARAPVVGTGGRLAQLPRAVAERGLRAVFRGALRAASARRRRVRERPAADAPLGDERVRPGARLSRLPPRPHQGRQPRLPRARLQQGRGRCCTCCGGWSATRRSSTACAASTPRRASARSAPTSSGRRSKRRPAGRSIASSSSGSTGSTLPRLQVTYRVEGAELAVHVEQLGEMFDVPVTADARVRGQDESRRRRPRRRERSPSAASRSPPPSRTSTSTRTTGRWRSSSNRRTTAKRSRPKASVPEQTA